MFCKISFFHIFAHIDMNIQKKILASVLFVLISFLCSAQMGPPPPRPLPPPVGVPIDGNLVALLIVGFTYGIYKVLKLKKATAH